MTSKLRVGLPLSLAIVALHTVLVMVVGFRMVLPAMGLSMRTFMRATPLSFVFVLLFALGGTIMVLAALRWARASLKDLGWTSVGKQHIGWILGATLGAISLPVLVALSAGSSLEEIREAITGPSWNQRLLFLAIGTQAAFLEESIFRGMLFPALRARMPFVAALILQALLFSAYHLNFHPLALVGHFATGLILGIAAGAGDSTRPLWVPAVAHLAIWVVLGAL